MLTKKFVIGLLEIHEDGRLGVREDTVYFDDGVEVSRVYHRRVLEPGADVSMELDTRLKAVAKLIWKPDVIDAFEAKLAAVRANLPFPPTEV